MNLTSTPYLVLFVILGSIAVTTAYAGLNAHDIELDGDVWVTKTLMIDGDGIVMEDFIVEGDGIFHGDIILPDGTIIVGGNPVPIIIVGADDPNVADIDGKKGDIYIQDNGRFAINIDPTDEDSWSFGTVDDGATLTVDVIDPPTIDGNKGDHWVNTETGQVWLHLGDTFFWVKVDRPGEGTVFVDVRDPEALDGEVGDHWLNDSTLEVFLKVGNEFDDISWISIGETSFGEPRDPEDSDGVPGDHWVNSITRQVFLKLIDNTWQSLGVGSFVDDRDPEDSDGAIGDIWKNAATDQFFVKFSDGWFNVGSDIFVESRDPDSLDGEKGDHWLNTDTGQLWLHLGDTNFWIKVGAAPEHFAEPRDPDFTDGKEGDHWLNTETGDVFYRSSDDFFWINLTGIAEIFSHTEVIPTDLVPGENFFAPTCPHSNDNLESHGYFFPIQVGVIGSHPDPSNERGWNFLIDSPGIQSGEQFLRCTHDGPP